MLVLRLLITVSFSFLDKKMNYEWKILEVFANNEVITGCRYHLTGTDGDTSVETEGNWYFDCPTPTVPFSEVTEEMIVSWVENSAVKDGQNHIKINIENQIKALNSSKPVVAPWLPQTYIPSGT
jgi:hypothetical protein